MAAQEKQKVLQAIGQLGRRVTAADVSSKTGLPLHVATSQLNAIAAETGGNLQVGTAGDIAYCFAPAFQNAYLARGIRRLLQQAGSALFQVGYYLLRISFGIMLVVSLVVIGILIFVVLNTINRSGDGDRDSGFEFNFLDYMIIRDLFWWGSWSTYGQTYRHDQPTIRDRQDGNFFLNCFSFLFGDGNPNDHLEERRWQLIAQVIKQNDGVATSELLAPYLGSKPKDDSAVLPALVRFDGRPEVTETGNIVYAFPSMQVSASAGGEHIPIKWNSDPYLKEFLWKFSHVSSDGLVPVALLAGVNFFGAWWLLWQLSTPVAGRILLPFAGLIDVLMVYGTLFIALPLARYLVIQYFNRRIKTRNQDRLAYAEELNNPSEELKAKLSEAQVLKIQDKKIEQGEIVYTTEQDALEQEFKPEAARQITNPHNSGAKTNGKT